MKNKAIIFLIHFIALLALTIIFSTYWLQQNFGNLNFEKIVFHLNVPLDGTHADFILGFVTNAVLLPITIFLLYLYIFYQNQVVLNRTFLLLRFRKHSLRVRVFPISEKYKVFPLFVLLVFISSLTFAYKALGMENFYEYSFEDTKIYDQYYIDPSTTDINFPTKKRNLILIYLESVETTVQSKKVGGAFKNNYIAEMTKLANKHVNFSHNDKVGGALQVSGTGWTIAAMVAHTAGIPLRIPIHGNKMDRYSSFLPGAVTLGDILEQAGYQQTLIIGSDKSFGGRDLFFEEHGSFSIFDYNYYIETGKLPEGYQEFWGFEDKKLYGFSREELLELSGNPEPFHLSILTVDTHPPNGYLSSLCEDKYESQYSNVLACASKQLYDFIAWIKQQPFYKNTTIVVVSDHLSMNKDYFDNIPEDFERRNYNVIINSPISPIKSNNRVFTSMDFFPTILESLDVSIDAPGLGLGRSLWGAQQTLSEQMGSEKFDKEIAKRSKFYNRLLYGK